MNYRKKIISPISNQKLIFNVTFASLKKIKQTKKMSFTKIYVFKNSLAYILLFAFINIINYIPDYAFHDDPIVLDNQVIIDEEGGENMPTSIVEVVLEDFFQFPESKFSFEDLKDFSTNTNRYARIAKIIQKRVFIELPVFFKAHFPLIIENNLNRISTSYEQHINTLIHAGFISFIHLLYPF